MLAEADAYLTDPGFRRDAMLASLRNHDNLYSRQRISSYGLDTRGWDALPEWTPRSVEIDRELADAIGEGRIGLPEGTEPLWDGVRPETMDEWVALGREVFFRYPLRADPYVAFGVANPEIGEAFGLIRDASGRVPGAVIFRDVDGEETVGITCALCHAAERDDEFAIGAARRDLDYGALRIAFHDETGVPVDPELRRRMGTWGPGRADITEDDGEDPVAIPDLYGLRHQSTLTQAGTIVHDRPAALALRQETQYLHANHQRARPPRELSWAVAMYLYSLSPGAAPAPSDPEAAARGETIFERECTTCHHNRVGGGNAISAEVVGTDPALAIGEARGTGLYRPPALLRVQDAAPYFHNGAVPDLEDLFSPERLEADYDRSPVGSGPVVGHRYGIDLSDDDTRDLIMYLRSR